LHSVRDAKHQAFAAAEVRLPAHVGSAYPDDPAAMKQVFTG